MGNPAENRSSAQNSEISEQPVAPAKPPFENMVWIPGGTFIMGSAKHYPEEAPAHEVTVDGFWIDTHTVTNEEFRRFVEATKHVTSAEQQRAGLVGSTRRWPGCARGQSDLGISQR